MLMRKYGRRAGFSIGAIFGYAGCFLCALGLDFGNFWVFIAGTSCMGAFNAFNQYLRFAAAETASKSFRPKAISLVIGGGIIAAFVGGTLAGKTGSLLLPQFLATYLILAVTPLLFAITIQFVRMPEPAAPVRKVDGKQSTGRPLSVIMKQPAFIVAATVAWVVWAGMILMMAATALFMHHAGLVDDVPFLVQWHMFAMVAPSFSAGSVIGKFGYQNVVVLGFILFFGGITAGLMGITVSHYFITNMFIGAGWNFMLIGSTALLVTCHTEVEKGKVQGANDTLAYILSAISSFFAGYRKSEFVWDAVMIANTTQVVIVRVGTSRVLPAERRDVSRAYG